MGKEVEHEMLPALPLRGGKGGRRRLETWLVVDRAGRRRYWIEAGDAETGGAYLEAGDRLIAPHTRAIADARAKDAVAR